MYVYRKRKKKGKEKGSGNASGERERDSKSPDLHTRDSRYIGTFVIIRLWYVARPISNDIEALSWRNRASNRRPRVANVETRPSIAFVLEIYNYRGYHL
ncbi:hypothetical protein PUN28_015627 [Cardiocondyla obscurior]|uniref:Uncharacterized protein n=1 Tax=Cardiocondyla obscurior TaxID=286306 RepID=A0AAW2EV61_9HYME